MIIFIHKFCLPETSKSKAEGKTPQNRHGSDWSGCEKLLIQSTRSILINLINEANLSRGSTLMAFSGYFCERGNVIL